MMPVHVDDHYYFNSFASIQLAQAFYYHFRFFPLQNSHDDNNCEKNTQSSITYGRQSNNTIIKIEKEI